MDGLGIRARNLKTGKSLNVIRQSVLVRESALKTYLEMKLTPRHSRRLSNEQLKARLIVFMNHTSAVLENCCKHDINA